MGAVPHAGAGHRHGRRHYREGAPSVAGAAGLPGARRGRASFGRQAPATLGRSLELYTTAPGTKVWVVDREEEVVAHHRRIFLDV